MFQPKKKKSCILNKYICIIFHFSDWFTLLQYFHYFPVKNLNRGLIKIWKTFRYCIFLGDAELTHCIVLKAFTKRRCIGNKTMNFTWFLWTGSSEERRVYKKALAKILGSNITEGHTEPPDERSSETVRNPGISGKFKLVEPPVFGKDITLILILNNLSFDHKTVKVDMSASTVLYTRRAVAEILKATTSVDLGSKQGNFNVPEEPVWPRS